MGFNFIHNDSIPGGAWLAHMTAGDTHANVEIGKFVDFRKDWFVFGVWDGDFKSGNFMESQFKCCSGGVYISASRKQNSSNLFEIAGGGINLQHHQPIYNPYTV